MREGLPLAGHVLQVQSGCKGIAVHTDDLQRTHEDDGGRRLCKSCGMLRSSCLAQSACCLYSPQQSLQCHCPISSLVRERTVNYLSLSGCAPSALGSRQPLQQERRRGLNCDVLVLREAVISAVHNLQRVLLDVPGKFLAICNGHRVIR